MDDDPVLRSLGAELERDDPELAALLTGNAPLVAPSRRARTTGRTTLRLIAAFVLLGVLAAGLLLPMRVVLGMIAMLVILASPLVVCWLLENTDGRATPRHP